MIIKTKYDIGHTFWVPRCVEEYSTEEMNFEGETWNRNVVNYVGYAKQKRIMKVVASTYAGTKVHIQYYVLNTDQDEHSSMSQVYSEGEINDYTEQQALEIALDFQAKKEEYYGN